MCTRASVGHLDKLASAVGTVRGIGRPHKHWSIEDSSTRDLGNWRCGQPQRGTTHKKTLTQQQGCHNRR